MFLDTCRCALKEVTIFHKLKLEVTNRTYSTLSSHPLAISFHSRYREDENLTFWRKKKEELSVTRNKNYILW